MFEKFPATIKFKGDNNYKIKLDPENLPVNSHSSRQVSECHVPVNEHVVNICFPIHAKAICIVYECQVSLGVKIVESDI